MVSAVALPLCLPVDNSLPRRWWAGDVDPAAPGRPWHAGVEQIDGLALVIELQDAAELAAVRAHLSRLFGRAVGS